MFILALSKLAYFFGSINSPALFTARDTAEVFIEYRGIGREQCDDIGEKQTAISRKQNVLSHDMNSIWRYRRHK